MLVRARRSVVQSAKGARSLGRVDPGVIIKILAR
jgi:hypothetical protein